MRHIYIIRYQEANKSDVCSLTTIKAICKKPAADITLRGEKLKTFPLGSEFLQKKLAKEARDLYTKTHKMLLKAITEDTNKWKDILHLWV